MTKNEAIETQLLRSLESIRNSINILIGIQIRQDKNMSTEQKIKTLKKIGMSYTDIEKVLGVSSATIASSTKKKPRRKK